MTGDLDDRRVADRDPAHVIDRHRLLVIGQRVGRHAIEQPQRAVQPDHHRRQRLVAQRHHRPDSATTPATRRTTPSLSRPRPARRHSPTASTTPAPGSTAASAARASAANGAWPPPPPAGSCAPTPDTPSRPASSAPDPHRSGRASDRPTPRSSPRTGPPAAAAARAPAARHPPPPARDHTARPSCDHTPPAPPPARNEPVKSYASRISITSSALFTRRPPRIARRQQRRARVPTPQDRTVGRNRGHPWGETVAASGEIPWPPMGSFPWPPSPLVPIGEWHRAVEFDRVVENVGQTTRLCRSRQTRSPLQKD